MLALAAPQEAQVEWARKALDLAEQTECERAAGWAAALYNNLGWTYHNLERYDEALVQFEKGLAYRQDRAQEGRPVHIARWCIARTLRSLGKLEQAIEQQTQLLEVHDSGFVHEELGECLLALGRDEESVDYFAQAYHMLSKDDWLAHDEPDRLARLKKLGWVPAHE